MFETTSYGLGDAYSDCLATVAGLPADHVFKGQAVSYTASVVAGIQVAGVSDASAAKAAIAANLAAHGFYGISVDVSGNWLLNGTVTINAIAPIDFNSSNDIAGIFDGAVNAACSGCLRGAGTLSTARASADSICAPYQGGGVLNQQPAFDPTNPAGSAVSIFDNLGQTLGIGATGIAIGALVILFLMAKR